MGIRAAGGVWSGAGRGRLFRPAAIILILIFAGCTLPSPDEDSVGSDAQGDPVHLLVEFEPHAPTGVRLYDIQASGPIRLEMLGEHQIDPDNYAPLHVAFLLPNGTIEGLVRRGDFDNAFLAQGDGVVYAGVGDQSVHSPNASTNDFPPNRYAATLATQSDRALLMIAWGNPPGVLALDFYGPRGTSMTLASEAAATIAELRDHRGGAHVGFPGAVVSQGDRLTLGENERMTLGYVYVLAGGVATGRIDVAGGGLHESIGLTTTPMEAGDFSVMRYYFAAPGPVDIISNFAADGRTRVFVVAAPVADGLVRPLWAPVVESWGEPDSAG